MEPLNVLEKCVTCCAWASDLLVGGERKRQRENERAREREVRATDLKCSLNCWRVLCHFERIFELLTLLRRELNQLSLLTFEPVRNWALTMGFTEPAYLNKNELVHI